MHHLKYLLFIIFFYLTACKPNVPSVDVSHQPMFTAYETLNRVVRTKQLDSLVLLLHPKSRNFYHKITDPKNLNLDSIVSIGTRYRVPYFAMKYLGSCGDYMKESKDPTDFFRFLALTDISIFSDSINYHLYKEESRLEKDAWVAIFKREKKTRKVNWVKFVRPDSTTYQYDLMYNLKLEERINRKIFKAQRKKHYKLTDEEFIKMYYPTFDKQDCALDNKTK